MQQNPITGFDEERELHLFTQTLFNRLMFVYFISRKGWLSYPDADGNGDTDYLNALWEAYLADDSQSNFYTARLKPLFFAGLNNPQSRNLSMNNPVLYETIGEVPFLNGGLFEKNELDARDTAGVSVAGARKIAAALERVTVLDPACGSGAYLLGMMQELVDLQTTLFNAGVDSKAIYDLKLEIIRRNLYGADIDDFAVNIAMLRLWLSLAIDYEGDDPPPLPNLDFKIACGDSLLAPDPSPQNYGDLFGDFIRQFDLGSLISEHMRATEQPEKDRLKAEIEHARQQIREMLGDATGEDIIDWRVEFAEVMGDGGFDVVVANPPYVRQEQIASKAELVRLYSDAVTARSDLYCHFYARGLQLLRDGGMHVFVCSNSWLDVGYGAKLQEHLLSAASVEAIYESAVERQFSTAQINTIVSVIRKGGADEDRDTRFISLRGEFDSAIADAGLRREITMSRLQLTEAGLGGADSRGRRKYVGDKWGGKYLRAPDIYHHIMNTRAGRLVRLGNIATVRRGVTTGANAFFYLTPERIAEFGIEDEYLRPVMTSPQESRSIAVDAATLPKRLFMCHAEKDELTGTGALEYINWGESQGYHRRSSVRSRRRWYDLGRRDQVHLGLGKFANTTVRTFLNPSGILFTDNFQIMAFQDDVQSASLCAALNSTLCQLMFNISARSNFGEGVLEIQTYETAGLSILNPTLLPDIDGAIFASSDWDALTPSPERRQLDAPIFDALRLTAAERDAVYAGVSELVGNRLRRARSV